MRVTLLKQFSHLSLKLLSDFPKITQLKWTELKFNPGSFALDQWFSNFSVCSRITWRSCSNSECCVHPQFLIQWVWHRAWDFELLTGFQVMLILLIWRPHFKENNDLDNENNKSYCTGHIHAHIFKRLMTLNRQNT